MRNGFRIRIAGISFLQRMPQIVRPANCVI